MDRLQRFSEELSILSNKLHAIVDRHPSISKESREKFKKKLGFLSMAEDMKSFAILYWVENTHTFWAPEGTKNRDKTISSLLVFVLDDEQEAKDLFSTLSDEVLEDCWSTISDLIKISILHVYEQRKPRLDNNGKMKFTETYVPAISVAKMKKVWG